MSFLPLLVLKFCKIFQATDKLKSCVLDVRLPLFFAGNIAQQLVLKANFGLKSRMNILSTLYYSAVKTTCAGSQILFICYQVLSQYRISIHELVSLQLHLPGHFLATTAKSHSSSCNERTSNFQGFFQAVGTQGSILFLFN